MQLYIDLLYLQNYFIIPYVLSKIKHTIMPSESQYAYNGPIMQHCIISGSDYYQITHFIFLFYVIYAYLL